MRVSALSSLDMRGVWLILLLLSFAALLWFTGYGGAPLSAVADSATVPLPRSTSAATSEAPNPQREQVGEASGTNAPSPSAGRLRQVPGTTVHGRVLLANRAPAAGAGLHAGGSSTHADAGGAFTLVVDDPNADLVAWHPGQQPVVLTEVALHPDVVAGRAIEVVLAGTPLQIDGWLRLADGTPATGWHLMLHGGTLPSGDAGLPPASAEDFAAGAGAPNADRSSLMHVRDHPNVMAIGDSGAFAVHGLRLGCAYTLRAWNASTLQTVVSAPIPAGTRGYIFVVPPGSWRDRVRGRTIARDGAPVHGVRVRLSMRVHQNGDSEAYETGQEVRTDADGWFSFLRVPHEALLLRFDGDDVVSSQHELGAHAPADDLLIQLQTLCRLRCLRAPDTPRACSLRVLDAQQNDLRVTWEGVAGHRHGGTRIQWPEGEPSIQLGVSDAAVWLILEVDGTEVRRVAVNLRRDEMTVIRL